MPNIKITNKDGVTLKTAGKYCAEDISVIIDSNLLPNGKLSIVKNGTYDIESYELVNVNVPIPDDYIKPSGTLEVTENGNHNIREYESVNVNINTNTTTKSITPTLEVQTFTPPSGYIGFSEVSVSPPNLEYKEVTPTKETQTFKPTGIYIGYSDFVVNPIPNEYIIPSGTLDVTTNGSHDVTNYSSVNVNIPISTISLQEKTVTPTKETQEVVNDNNYDGLSKVTINPIPDDYIVPSGTLEITSNGEQEVSQYANVNVDVKPNLQQKSVIPTRTSQTVVSDNGYDGLFKVTINPIPEEYIVPNGFFTIVKNGTHDVTTFASVNVNVPIPEGYIIPSGTLDVTENGEKDVKQYEKVNVDVKPNLQEKTVTPTDNEQNIVCDSGYDGLSKVTVRPIEGYVKYNDYYNLLNRTITEFEMPYEVYNVYNYSFVGCKQLRSFNFTRNIGSIGEHAFESCSSLTSITLPETVSQIGYNAFAECSRLESINIQDTIISKIAVKTFYNCQKLNNITIPETVSQIEANAFEQCSSLQNITIPNSVTSIGQQAFKSCSALEQITLPENLVEISSSLFYLCRKLSTITIGENIQRIGPQAFLACSALTEIIIPNNVTYIGLSSFEQCSSLQKLTIPFVGQDKTSGYTWFGYIFGDEADKRGRNIPSSLTEVVVTGGDLQMGAFQMCGKIKNISIPQDTKVIPQQCFYYCEALENFVIPQGVTDIGTQAFYKCKSMTSVVIPDSVTSIAGNVFDGCSSLTSVTIPNSVTSIGNYALEIGSETNKATITMLSTTPPSIQGGTFSKSKLNQLIVPIGCGDAYKSATNWSSFADYIVEASE